MQRTGDLMTLRRDDIVTIGKVKDGEIVDDDHEGDEVVNDDDAEPLSDVADAG